MYYVYVLKMSNDQIYIGFTKALEKRIREHKTGAVFTTSKYLPIKPIYFECYLSDTDARQREKMLKRYGSTWSHLRNRIKNSLNM